MTDWVGKSTQNVSLQKDVNYIVVQILIVVGCNHIIMLVHWIHVEYAVSMWFE